MQRDITVIKINGYFSRIKERDKFKVVAETKNKLYYRNEDNKLEHVFKVDEGITFEYVRLANDTG